MSPGRQSGFGGQRVYGVDDDCLRRNHNTQIVGVNEVLNGAEIAFRIDCGKALGKYGGFGLSQRVFQSRQLSVDVAFGHRIAVNQRQSTDTAARQRLGAPAADAAQTHHADVSCGDGLKRSLPVESLNAAESTAVFRVHQASFLSEVVLASGAVSVPCLVLSIST